MKDIKNNLLKCMTIIFFISITFSFLFSIIKNNIQTISFDYLWVFFIFILFFIVTAFLYKITSEKKLTKKYLFFFFFLLFLVQLIYVRCTYSKYGWDCGTVIESAINLHQDHFKMPYQKYYFSAFPNNICLLLLIKEYFSIVMRIIPFSNYYALLAVFNLVLIDLSIFLLYLIAKELTTNKNAKFALFLGSILIGLHPWIIVPYTDTMTLFIPLLIFYLYLKIRKDPKKLYFFLLGILSLFAYKMKPTCIIILISIIIIELFYVKWKQIKWKKLCFNFFSFFLGAFLFFLFFQVLTNYELGKSIKKKDYDQNKYPMIHWAMMGSGTVKDDTGHTYYGVFNPEDSDFTYEQKGYEKKKKNVTKRYLNRLKEYGVLGYVNFLAHKFIWISTDGTFFFGNEGSFYKSEPFHQDELSKFIQKNFTIKKNQMIANVYQGMYAGILFYILFCLVLERKKKPKRKKEKQILELSILGLFMFVLLFEGRSRYLFNYYPIFLLLIAISMEKIPKKKQD